MTAPLLFGIDPDETWDFVPKAARDAGLSAPVFVLRCPTLATSIKREQFLAMVTKEAIVSSGDALDIYRRLGHLNDEAPKDAETLAAWKAENADNLKSLADATTRWLRAWNEATAAHAEEEMTISAKYLSEGILEWRELVSSTGRVIDFSANKGRILEVLRGPIVSELCEALALGAQPTKEEQVGLPSTQVSSAA